MFLPVLYLCLKKIYTFTYIIEIKVYFWLNYIKIIKLHILVDLVHYTSMNNDYRILNYRFISFLFLNLGALSLFIAINILLFDLHFLIDQTFYLSIFTNHFFSYLFYL